MNYKILVHTLRHLRGVQVWYQLRHRVQRAAWSLIQAPPMKRIADFPFFIPKPVCLKGETFTFLNISSPFTSWDDTSHGMLWTYNQNYMDWLCQEKVDFKTGATWIDRFIDDLAGNSKGLDPYPIALRGINWIKFIAKHRDEIEAERLARWQDSLYSQYVFLTKELEFHLLGNHLLEDAYSLFIAAIFFDNARFYRRASSLLRRELKEQVMTDGAHYEQSPMYHCILLDRLLDCYNISTHNHRFAGQEDMDAFMKETAERMLGHMESIVYKNGDIPLLNDAAEGIAPTTTQIRDYAQRLGLKWEPVNLNACGYRKWSVEGIELVLDVGNISATYQPGHSHADTFNYELRLDGNPFIVDTGISTYDKTQRRQYERSTAAHNTVSVDGFDSSEVWGGFRMGKQAKVQILSESRHQIKALHNGSSKKRWHQRTFELTKDCLIVTDHIADGHKGINYIHLAPNERIIFFSNTLIQTTTTKILIENCEHVEIKTDMCATRYNRLQPSIVAKIYFYGIMSYYVQRPEAIEV